MAELIAFGLFARGAFVCLLNFYLNFLRHPLPRLLLWGGRAHALRDTGGLPSVGGVMVWMFCSTAARYKPGIT